MPKTTITLPAPAPGTHHTLTVHRFGSPGARPKAYFQAALHADEWPGLLVLQHLLRLLKQAETDNGISGEVVVVPVANPVGLDQHINGYLPGRFDFGGSGNFNRHFPDLAELVWAQLEGRLGDDAEANVTLIRQILHEAVVELPRLTEVAALKATLLSLSIDADLVFDLHCDSDALLHLYASRHHQDIAAEFGAQLGAAVILLEDNPGGIPFDEANAGLWWKLRARLAQEIPLACFASTVELRGRADVCDYYAEQDAANLYRFLQRRSVISGDPGSLPAALGTPTPLEGVDILKAPAGGIVVYCKNLGAWVRKGETVVELVDLTGDDPNAARAPVPSGTDGILFTRSAEKLVRPGQNLCKVAGVAALAYRQAGQLLED